MINSSDAEIIGSGVCIMVLMVLPDVLKGVVKGTKSMVINSGVVVNISAGAVGSRQWASGRQR